MNEEKQNGLWIKNKKTKKLILLSRDFEYLKEINEDENQETKETREKVNQ